LLRIADWKRLVAADGPRQSINALTLYSFAYANDFQTSNLPAYWDNSISTLLLLLSMIATVLIWAISMFLLIVAAICYVPLLCYIRGNLKVSGYLTSMITEIKTNEDCHCRNTSAIRPTR
jgi:hypothetical protein